jgi:hypothetical protein
MSATIYDELNRYSRPKTDDPGILARRRMIIGWFLEASPDLVEEMGVAKGRLEQARKSLRRVLRVSGLGLSAEDEALVDACNVLDTLERWLDQAAVATTAAEALR